MFSHLLLIKLKFFGSSSQSKYRSKDYCKLSTVVCISLNWHIHELEKDGETVAQFVAELRRLSEHCAFQETLDDMLRDRLVCGIKDSRVQRRLLSETDLTFKKAFKLSQASEVSEKNARDLHKPTGAVHAIRTQQPPKKNSPCYRCSGKHSGWRKFTPFETVTS